MRVQLDERARDNERARRRVLVLQGVQALLRLLQLGVRVRVRVGAGEA